jgi:hypothetical protein
MAEPMVFFPRKRFRQDVGDLIVGRDVSGNNCPRLEAVPHMVVVDFYMFGCLVKDGISSQWDGGLIVGIQDSRI